MEAKKSKDVISIEAIAQIKNFKTFQELKAFISDNEDRSTVLKAAEAKESEIKTELAAKEKAKQGEQPGPITQITSDFKDGVQRTKELSGSDIISAIDKADLKKSEALAVEAQKREKEREEKKAGSRPEGVVTCDDVIKKMRTEGKKI